MTRLNGAWGRRAAGPLSKFLRAALAAATILLPAATSAAPKHVELSARDQADIQAAQFYLNGISTLKARFLQIAGNGAQAEGTAYLSRPGKMRLQYDPPSPLLVVADGSFLIVLDRTVDNPSYIPLGSTPAGVLVRENVELNGKDLAVTKVSHEPGVLEVSVVEREDPDSGKLTLVFSERPFQLRQWRVVDAQGQTTTVSLFNIQTGVTLDPKLFEFRDARFERPPNL